MVIMAFKNFFKNKILTHKKISKMQKWKPLSLYIMYFSIIWALFFNVFFIAFDQIKYEIAWWVIFDQIELSIVKFDKY